MANNGRLYYAPVKWEERLWRFLDGHVDSLRISLKALDTDAVHAVANCRAALKRMHRSANVRVESDAIVVFR